MNIKNAIESGDKAIVESLLMEDNSQVNEEIVWGNEYRSNRSHPLHYVSDVVFNGIVENGSEGDIAKLLINYGADVDGLPDKYESSLIGSTSLAVDKVSDVLIDAGANQKLTSIHKARALQWAAWVGSASIVDKLVKNNDELDYKCDEFGATALFWAVHGYSRHGSDKKRAQVTAAECLINNGADINTKNKHGDSLLSIAKDSDDMLMFNMLVEKGVG